MLIVGFSGSLREGSFNRALIQAAADLSPASVDFEIVEIDQLPLYNPDIDQGGLTPAAAEVFRERIVAADALVLATPEYNHSVSGAMKNAIDWASRPARQSGLRHKPVAIVSASPGGLGGVRAQEHLKSILLGTLSNVFPHGGVVVGSAGSKISDGALKDERTREFLATFVAQFAEWAASVQPSVAA